MSAQQDGDVARLFANMTEMEIISLRLDLENGAKNSIGVLDPENSKLVFVTMEDLDRRDKQHRDESQSLPEPTSAPSNYNEIEDYYEQATPAQVAQIAQRVLESQQQVVEAPIEMQNDTAEVRLPTRASESNRGASTNPNRRRYLIASVVGLILLLIGVAVVVAVVLLIGSNDVICGGLEFKCADGQKCVSSSKFCDGNNDCGDLSDETNCTTTSTTAATPVVERCILLIGGGDLGSTPLIEYYNPTKDGCDKDAIGMMSTEKINITHGTSGCYLSDTKQIVIREGAGTNTEKPPMLYGLLDSSALQLPVPPTGYTVYTTAASISPTKCLSCGGRNEKNLLVKECYQFDSSSPTEWTSIRSLPLPLAGSASVSMENGNSYYVVGGVIVGANSETVSKEVFRYSVDKRQWYKETSMAQGRVVHSAAALSATEFIICGGEYTKNGCEVYSTTEKKWRPVGNLNTGRYYFAMRRFNGIVYAIGGWGDGNVQLDSVEAYSVQTEKWTEIKKLKHRRFAFVSVVV